MTCLGDLCCNFFLCCICADRIQRLQADCSSKPLHERCKISFTSLQPCWNTSKWRAVISLMKTEGQWKPDKDILLLHSCKTHWSCLRAGNSRIARLYFSVYCKDERLYKKPGLYMSCVAAMLKRQPAGLRLMQEQRCGFKTIFLNLYTSELLTAEAAGNGSLPIKRQVLKKATLKPSPVLGKAGINPVCSINRRNQQQIQTVCTFQQINPNGRKWYDRVEALQKYETGIHCSPEIHNQTTNHLYLYSSANIRARSCQTWKSSQLEAFSNLSLAYPPYGVWHALPRSSWFHPTSQKHVDRLLYNTY